jgi:hypothetical protein
MTIHLSDEQGEALLRAASKSGYVTVVKDLLDAGVKASSFYGTAALLAEYYGHEEVLALLREAMAEEKMRTRASKGV